ncbi:hypothetical protein HW115_02565 [Verrucomicrobiaceae bacterium N1E253]|uniref:Uncharacterized protein n=1 Tax=Oceaniferula marina TaxID=2748318 RepID=A0A851GH75_9BACT|nr:hypothetical protein [Oceaniferula marina]NWK54477.1 hypothetical protein [Oceaniferula marina]
MSQQDRDARDLGTQPLDKMMQDWGLGNHDLVEVSTEQLTHKQVQKARTGRRLTLKMMQKVTRAYNVAIWYQLKDEEKEAYYEYLHRDLFNYAKGHDPAFVDPNQALMLALKERKPA